MSSKRTSMRLGETWIQKLLLLGIHGYRHYISPALPRCCRFHPSCSQYAEGCLTQYSLFQAVPLVMKRVLKCHPFHPGGIDLVPRTQWKS
jgi:hypothetical protein